MPVKVKIRERKVETVLAYMKENYRVNPRRGTIVWKKRYRVGEIAGCPQGTKGSYWRVVVLGEMCNRSWLIFAWVNGRWPSEHLDHIDGESFNDAISNLRESTIHQNAWNHRRRKTHWKLPMGVFKSGGKFGAHIMKNRVRERFTGFQTPEDAHLFYVEKRKELFQEFA